MSDVDSFLERMNRLKTALGLSKDKEVAAALGMSDKALNARKARGSFPERELRSLGQARPELALDVDYVLSGKRSPGHMTAKLKSAGERLRLVRGTRTIQEFASQLEIDPGYLEQVETAAQWLSHELLARVVDQESISPMWLLSGELPRLDAELSPLEIVLIDNYRHLEPAQQAKLRQQAAAARAAAIAAKSTIKRVARADKKSDRV